ncbi:MAG: T9SS type A sorting domain-containing protein [candidate division Zixibacteria bacterium]|nr:T9SS type A sorting domain-containing protein [candidate division Zixibacteria bacterium]
MKQTLALLLLCLALTLPAAVFGDVWEKTVVDSTGTATGINIDIALDRDGHPHLSYADLDDIFLFYAEYNGSTWTTEAVDMFGLTGLHTAIALDSADHPHIAYTGHINKVRHVYHDGADWINTVVDTGVSIGLQGHLVDMAIDNRNRARVLYSHDQYHEIRLATLNDDTWDIETVVPCSVSINVRLVLRNDSIPVIGYHEMDTGWDSLRVVWKVTPGGPWLTTTVPDQICMAGTFFQSFAVDSDGNFYWLYESYMGPCIGMGTMRLAKFDGSTWIFEDVPEPSSDPFEFFPLFPASLEIDNNGYPALVADTFLYWKNNGTWEFHGLGNQMNDEGVAVFSKLIFDQYNSPRMAFGQPWAVYYQYSPGDPQINVPEAYHEWTENYVVWNCRVENTGVAPLRLDSLRFTVDDSTFHLPADPSPLYIGPSGADSIAIRFAPDSNQTYYDTLTIFCNDPVTPTVAVALEGTASFSDSTGDLILQAQNCYAAPEYHSINRDIPAAGVAVELYQGGILKYGPVYSDQTGSATQGGIDVGDYDVRLWKVVEFARDDKSFDTVATSFSIHIDTGLVADTAVFPESLLVQSYQWVWDLSHIQDDTLMYAYGAEAHQDNSVRDLLDDWRIDMDSLRAESLARLILAQEMVDQFYFTGRNLGIKGFEGIADLLHFSVKACNNGGWLEQLWKVIQIVWNLWAGDKVQALMDILQMMAQYIILELVDMVVDQMAAHLPCVEDPLSGMEVICGGDVLHAAWKDLRKEFNAWELPSFNQEDGPQMSWDHMKKLVYEKLRWAFIQVLYINILTNDELVEAKNKSESMDFSEDFPTASMESNENILQSRLLLDGINDAADNMILTAALLMKTVIIMGYLEAFVPGLGFLDDLKTITMYASIGLDIAASGLALGGFFAVSPKMNNATDKIYHPLAKAPPQRRVPARYLATAAPNPAVQARLRAQVAAAVLDYDSSVTILKDHIANNRIEDAMYAVEDVMQADVAMMQSIEVASAPMYSVAHAAYDTLLGFAPVYDQNIQDAADAGMARVFTYISLVQLPADSSTTMKDYLTAHLDTTVYLAETWSDGVLELMDSVASMDLPAIIVSSDAAQDKFSLTQIDTATITMHLENVGALAGDSIAVVLETSEGLHIYGTDSAYVGTLDVGATSTQLTFEVGITDTTLDRVSWTAVITSPNAETYDADGSFKVNPAVPTDVDEDDTDNLLPADFLLHQNHPNPFNPVTQIEFDLPRLSLVKLDVYNVMGQRVVTLIDGTLRAGVHRVEWDATGVASGVYFYRLTAGAYEDTKKMVLLK